MKDDFRRSETDGVDDRMMGKEIKMDRKNPRMVK